MIEIKIPATSANIGSGFDSLGLAVGMHNRVWMELWDGVLVESVDNTPIPTDEHNLVYKTAKYLFDICGKPFCGLHIRQENAIPMARGLGSSSACIVAGLMGANILMESPLTSADIINMAAAMEGHPDNSTPAILGGQVTAAMENGKVYYCRQQLPDDLQFVTIIPDFELKTSLARSALPKEIEHKEAVYNLSRAALMASSLCSGHYENLRVACGDKLHQPYRLGLIKGGQQVLATCLEYGAYGAYLSGAGSTLMAIVPASDQNFARQLRCWLDGRGLTGWRLENLSPDNTGTVVTMA
ncbi:MAG: homoserine kinase [Angelakisella sp.]|nr:homoserine kinase [Angelakisella sp.]